MRMLSKYQMWSSMTYRQRTLCAVFDALTANAAQHGIPACILEEAKAFYKRMSEAKIWRGENREALVATSLYMACKTNGVPRSVKEIAAMFNVRTAAMTKGCRHFIATLGLAVDSSGSLDFVARFCSRLSLSSDATRLVRTILERAEELDIMAESMPTTVVAGAIALAGTELGLGLRPVDVACACFLAPVTVHKCHKQLLLHRDELLRRVSASR
jgi:transcription initiation factor TFIIB